MEDANVAFRLKGFIDSQGLSHSQFSDRCGIPRPSLSQILSGRNKKISDVIVGQIHKAFPQLSILWLLFGEGDMIHENADADDESRYGSPSSGGGASFAGNGSLFEDEELEISDDGSIVPVAGVSGSGFSRSSGSDNSNFASKGTANHIRSNVNALNNTSQALKDAENKIVECENKIAELQLQIDNLRNNPRKVSHITVYYDDSTFETFVPGRK